MSLVIANCTNVQTFQEVKEREEIVARKEAMLFEKRELEMKKLRSSQALNKVTTIRK